MHKNLCFAAVPAPTHRLPIAVTPRHTKHDLTPIVSGVLLVETVALGIDIFVFVNIMVPSRFPWGLWRFCKYNRRIYL